MGVLDGLQPEAVFRYFEEICRIPHGSGNTRAISDYLVRFAEERGLEHYRDALNNVIIIKEAAPGYEAADAVILQGHMDMVAVKKPEAAVDMTKEGLKLAVEGDYLYARDTSLGGDDGIAVAYALALLEAENIPHPRLEAVLTVDEETGLEGASAVDISMCRAKKLLNLDSEEEGILTVSCAGGARFRCRLPLRFAEAEGVPVAVKICGLAGGHSGTEIHKGRANANCLLARFCMRALKSWDCTLTGLQGGLADNAIPREAQAEFLVKEPELEAFLSGAMEYRRILQTEYEGKEQGICVECRPEAGAGRYRAIERNSAQKAAFLLFEAPNGVEAMSAQLPGMVETSLNMGQIGVEGEELYMTFSVRSSIDSKKEMLLEKLAALTEHCGGRYEISGVYPGWAYREGSPLQKIMRDAYRKLYGKEPEVTAIHAGLECGLFLGKRPELDCVSYGPDMKDIHTTEEKLSISSVRRVWEYTLEVLKNCR